MKLFIVIYIFGQVAASVGPLKYSMYDCWAQTDKMNAKTHRNLMMNETMMQGELLTPDNFEYVCQMFRHRPTIAERFK